MLTQVDSVVFFLCYKNREHYPYPMATLSDNFGSETQYLEHNLNAASPFSIIISMYIM